MTATNHALAGSLIALTINQPILVLPIAFISHFLLDVLPHFGYPGSNFKDVLKHKLGITVTILDAFGLLFFIIVIFGQNYIVWLSSLVAISPDFAWVYRYYFYERVGKKPPSNLFDKYHEKIQWCERPWGVIAELGFFAIMASLLLKSIN